MKIWYQSYVIGGDPRFHNYDEALKRHVSKVARSDTEVDIHGVEKMAPRMDQSIYIQYLHIPQVIENALRAEREGYDAFILGGMLDLAYFELKEAISIPIAFIAEASFHLACLLAPTFSVVTTNEVSLRRKRELIRRYGLEERYVPGIHIGIPMLELVPGFEKNRQGIIDMVRKAAKKVIEQGAGILVPGFGGLSVFLAEQDIREIEGVPLLDNQAAVIKTAELLVDLKKLGIARSKKGPYISPSKEEVAIARKTYGVE